MLFEAVTKRADREGVKCYLESSKNVPNVMIYERMGFEMKMEMECRDGEDACMVCFAFCVPLLVCSFTGLGLKLGPLWFILGLGCWLTFDLF